MLETASFHIVKPCNMGCKFCYATFQDKKITNQLSLSDTKTILLKLKQAGLQKITFAGGEPMLYKNLDSAIIYAKSIGLVTSIITNGSFITLQWLEKMKEHLDWIGLSVDSLNPSTNEKIGRVTKTGPSIDYFELVDNINALGYKLKINTVVNSHNQQETLTDFITYARTVRWKVFDTLRVKGQNDKDFASIKSTDYEGFLKRNHHPSMVAESNDLMTGSYLLINPKGEFYENWGNDNRTSGSLVTHTVKYCLSQITLNRAKFESRGGIYNW